MSISFSRRLDDMGRWRGSTTDLVRLCCHQAKRWYIFGKILWCFPTKGQLGSSWSSHLRKIPEIHQWFWAQPSERQSKLVLTMETKYLWLISSTVAHPHATHIPVFNRILLHFFFFSCSFSKQCTKHNIYLLLLILILFFFFFIFFFVKCKYYFIFIIIMIVSNKFESKKR